jgi:xanthine dehydrogenase YagS FAD-binding subunit
LAIYLIFHLVAHRLEFKGTIKSRHDEVVTEIQVPQPPDGAKQTFIKFRLRESVDFPIVSVASVITIDGGVYRDARIALGAVAPAPIQATMVEQAIKGKAINAATAESASEAVITGAIPLVMNAYKVEITKTLVKRALLA